MARILDDDGLLDAADGFAGWDDALTDDMLAQELEQERAVELESELEQDERPIDYDAELEDAEEEAAPTSEKRLKRELRALWWKNGTSSTAIVNAGNGITRTCGAMYRWNIRRCRSRELCRAG